MQARGDLTGTTLFQRVEFEPASPIGRRFSIVTGIVYANVTAVRPRPQYCYVDATGNAAEIELAVRFVEKNADGGVEWARPSDATLKTTGLTRANVARSARACRFV